MASSPRRPRFYYGWVIVSVALMMNVASSPLNAAIFSFFVTPMSQDLGWSRGELSWGFTWRLVVAGISAPVLGILLDRYGTRVLGAVAGIIAGFTTMALALVSGVWAFYALSAVSGLSGYGAPAGQLLTTVPVAKWFQRNRGPALAIATIGLPLGTTLALPIVQQLIEAYGWRTAWVICGASVMVLTAPACLLFMRKDPESMGLLPDGRPPEPGLTEDGAPSLVADIEESWTASQVLRSPTLWAIAGAMGLSGLVLPGTVVYRVAFWEDTGLDASTVAFATALDPLTVTFSALVFGFLAEKMRTNLLGFLGGIIVAASMLPMVFARDSLALLLAYNLLWGTGMGANITVNNIIWPNYFGARFLGTIRGVVFPISVATSAISTPVFAALLDVSPDERYVWAVTLAAFLMSALLLLVSRKPRLSERATVPA